MINETDLNQKEQIRGLEDIANLNADALVKVCAALESLAEEIAELKDWVKELVEDE